MKTLKQLCDELGLNHTYAYSRLLKNNQLENLKNYMNKYIQYCNVMKKKINNSIQANSGTFVN